MGDISNNKPIAARFMALRLYMKFSGVATLDTPRWAMYRMIHAVRMLRFCKYGFYYGDPLGFGNHKRYGE